MKDARFSPAGLKFRRVTSQLFTQVDQAFSSTDSKISYLVIDSAVPMPESIFRCNVCPVYLHGNRSFLLLEGDCLWKQFLARKESDAVLSEESLWRLAGQMGQALVGLRRAGFEHRHMREYAVRRVGEDFKLVFHPAMRTAGQLIELSLSRWYSFYLAPEQLGDLLQECPNSSVFSLAAMILNLMNPLDFKRDIYSSQAFAVDLQVMREKLENAQKVYSAKLVDVVRRGLEVDPQKRPALFEWVELVESLDPQRKKLALAAQLKEYVGKKLSKSKEKRQIQPEINFERGTFGGEPVVAGRGTFGKTEEHIVEEKEQSESSHQSINSKEMENSQGYIENRQIAESESEAETEGKELTKMPQVKLFSQVQQSPQLPQLPQAEEYDQFHRELADLKARLSQNALELAQCLQPVSDIISSLKIEGIRMGDSTFFGPLIKGRRNGLGLQLFSNREYYFGYFREDLFHGEGFYYWNSSTHFLGQFQAGAKREGTWWGGVKYVGELKANRRHGFGCCYYPNGRTYQGQWLHGKRHGTGILSEPSGDKFVGQFKTGKKWGRGSFLSQGCRITAIWQDEVPQGLVQISYDNGSFYKGGVSAEYEKHGHGEFRFANGAVAVGQFEGDEFVRGEIRYRNGERYVGACREWRREGEGTYYYNDGRVARGVWRDGVFVGG